MGLRQWVQEAAVRRVHVLLAEVPGHFEMRVEAERSIRARGWVLALSPADADALLVVGTPEADLQTAIDAVYDQMPGPRAIATVEGVAHLGDRLEDLRDALLDDRAQREDARRRTAPGGGPGQPLDLAEGGDDRDGLEMDRTHLFLGPILPHWPAGLSLRCTLHGDTVMDHEVLSIPATAQAPAATTRAALRIDAAVDVLMLAGSVPAAERLRTLRDRCLTAEDVSAGLRTERDRLSRSRVLRWSLGEAHPASLALLDRAAEDLTGAPVAAHEVTPLGALIDGQDLATVRLRVAAAGPDLWNTVEVG